MALGGPAKEGLVVQQRRVKIALFFLSQISRHWTRVLEQVTGPERVYLENFAKISQI